MSVDEVIALMGKGIMKQKCEICGSEDRAVGFSYNKVQDDPSFIEHLDKVYKTLGKSGFNPQNHGYYIHCTPCAGIVTTELQRLRKERESSSLTT